MFLQVVFDWSWDDCPLWLMLRGLTPPASRAWAVPGPSILVLNGCSPTLIQPPIGKPWPNHPPTRFHTLKQGIPSKNGRSKDRWTQNMSQWTSDSLRGLHVSESTKGCLCSFSTFFFSIWWVVSFDSCEILSYWPASHTELGPNSSIPRLAQKHSWIPGKTNSLPWMRRGFMSQWFESLRFFKHQRM